MRPRFSIALLSEDRSEATWRGLKAIFQKLLRRFEDDGFTPRIEILMGVQRCLVIEAQRHADELEMTDGEIELPSRVLRVRLRQRLPQLQPLVVVAACPRNPVMYT